MNQERSLPRLPVGSKLKPFRKARIVREGENIHVHESLILFWGSFLLYLIQGIVCYAILHVGYGDALSRTANAYYVLYSRDPHLASIGFFWPPLPSLLQIPLLPIFKYFRNLLMAGPLVTSVFGAGSLVLLNIVLARFRIPKKLRWALVILTMLNPNFAHLSAIGMAEPILIFFLLMAIWGYLQMPYGTRSWIICGVGLAMAFLVRYESLGVMAGVAVAVFVLFWSDISNVRQELEGKLLAVLVPPAYVVAVWMFLNWIVMDNPLYFVGSEYSLSTAVDTAKISGLDHALFLAWGNIFYTAAYTFKRLFEQNLSFVLGALVMTFASIIRKKRKMIGLLIILLDIPIFTAGLVFIGTLPTWFRYWIYIVPFGAIIIAANYTMMKGVWRDIMTGLLVVLFALSIPFSLYTMHTDSTIEFDLQRLSTYIIAPDEEPALRADDGYYIFYHDGPILAEKIDEFSTEGIVMMDAAKSHFVIINVEHPERLMITNDRDFQETLKDPRGKVAYMLVPDDDNIFTRNYRGIYDGAFEWAQLVYEFSESTSGTMNNYRVFKIAAE